MVAATQLCRCSHAVRQAGPSILGVWCCLSSLHAYARHRHFLRLLIEEGEIGFGALHFSSFGHFSIPLISKENFSCCQSLHRMRPRTRPRPADSREVGAIAWRVASRRNLLSLGSCWLSR